MWIELILKGAVIRGKATTGVEDGIQLRGDLFIAWKTILESEYDEVVEQATRLANQFEKKLTEQRSGVTIGKVPTGNPESSCIHS